MQEHFSADASMAPHGKKRSQEQFPADASMAPHGQNEDHAEQMLGYAGNAGAFFGSIFRRLPE
jgi:hypothetical protein